MRAATRQNATAGMEPCLRGAPPDRPCRKARRGGPRGGRALAGLRALAPVLEELHHLGARPAHAPAVRDPDGEVRLVDHSPRRRTTDPAVELDVADVPELGGAKLDDVSPLIWRHVSEMRSDSRRNATKSAKAPLETSTVSRQMAFALPPIEPNRLYELARDIEHWSAEDRDRGERFFSELSAICAALPMPPGELDQTMDHMRRLGLERADAATRLAQTLRRLADAFGEGPPWDPFAP
jgi:hypothetical protein